MIRQVRLTVVDRDMLKICQVVNLKNRKVSDGDQPKDDEERHKMYFIYSNRKHTK